LLQCTHDLLIEHLDNYFAQHCTFDVGQQCHLRKLHHWTHHCSTTPAWHASLSLLDEAFDLLFCLYAFSHVFHFPL